MFLALGPQHGQLEPVNWQYPQEECLEISKWSEMSPDHLEHLNTSKSDGEYIKSLPADALGDKTVILNLFPWLEMSS